MTTDMNRPDMQGISQRGRRYFTDSTVIFGADLAHLAFDFGQLIGYVHRLETERNTWARQMADLHDVVETADQIAAAALQQRSDVETERNVLTVEVEDLPKRIGRDVINIALDYTDDSRDIIASMPFGATIMQVFGEKYGAELEWERTNGN